MHPNTAVEVLKLTLLFIPCFDIWKYKMMILTHFGIEGNFNKSIYVYISMSFRRWHNGMKNLVAMAIVLLYVVWQISPFVLSCC